MNETNPGLTAGDVAALFTRSDGAYLFARWGRAIVPVVFGVEETTLRVLKTALEAVVTLAGHEMADADPELGANLMMFFFRDWAELPLVPNLARMIDGLEPLCARLEAAGANQYRVFRFDRAGAIKAAFVFVRMDADLDEVPAETLALSQAVHVIVLWSDIAFSVSSPLARIGDAVSVRPEIGALIRACYDPVLPAMSRDASHALRLAARMTLP